jgi:prophage endopeptidase
MTLLLNPYFWLGIALACLLSFFGGCQHGKNKVMGQFDAHLAADKAATEAFNAESKAKEAKQSEALAQIGFRYEREKADALDEKDAVIRDLRAGKLSLRPQWKCPKAPVSGAPEGPGVADAEADLRNTDAGNLIGISATCDAQVRGLQSVLTKERE